jgi:hypothetical protein
MSDHPITPPPELVQQWFLNAQRNQDPDVVCWMQATAACAAKWGADQELEACCEWLEKEREHLGWAYRLNPQTIRAARRPKPPSLKEQALTALDAIATGANNAREQYLDFKTIRQALEQLDD